MPRHGPHHPTTTTTSRETRTRVTTTTTRRRRRIGGASVVDAVPWYVFLNFHFFSKRQGGIPFSSQQQRRHHDDGVIDGRQDVKTTRCGLCKKVERRAHRTTTTTRDGHANVSRNFFHVIVFQTTKRGLPLLVFSPVFWNDEEGVTPPRRLYFSF